MLAMVVRGAILIVNSSDFVSECRITSTINGSPNGGGTPIGERVITPRELYYSSELKSRHFVELYPWVIYSLILGGVASSLVYKL